MPKLLRARPPLDDKEERQVRKLAGSRHAPGDWIRRARMVARSWDGLRTSAIAAELGCHPETVRERLTRFNAAGLDGLGDRPGAGRKPRLTEAERSTLVALARSTPPGRPIQWPDGTLAAVDERPEAPARVDLGQPGRGCRRARDRDRAEPGAADPPEGEGPLASDPLLDDEHRSGLRPKRTRIVSLYTDPPADATVICADELGPVSPRTFPPASGWSGDGHRIKAPLEYSPRPGQGLDLRRPARARRPYADLHRPLAQHRRLP